MKKVLSTGLQMTKNAEFIKIKILVNSALVIINLKLFKSQIIHVMPLGLIGSPWERLGHAGNLLLWHKSPVSAIV